MRLANWPRNPYLNDELREWIALHLNALHVDDVAIYAMPQGRDDEGRRVLIATEIGLLDGSYAPRGSSAHYSLQIRLYPWPAVRGVDLLAETYRLWAYEHRTWWRLRVANPVLDVQTEDPDLGCALADMATACAMMADASTGQRDGSDAPAEQPAAEAPAPSLSTPAPHSPQSALEALGIEPEVSAPSLPEAVTRAASRHEA